MYHVVDTLNRRKISSHRTLADAIKSDAKFARAVRRANGGSSCIPTKIMRGGREWRECTDVTTEEYLAARVTLWRLGAL